MFGLAGIRLVDHHVGRSEPFRVDRVVRFKPEIKFFTVNFYSKTALEREIIITIKKKTFLAFVSVKNKT